MASHELAPGERVKQKVSGAYGIVCSVTPPTAKVWFLEHVAIAPVLVLRECALDGLIWEPGNEVTPEKVTPGAGNE